MVARLSDTIFFLLNMLRCHYFTENVQQ